MRIALAVAALLLLAVPASTAGSQVASVAPGIWNPYESTPVRLWLHCFGTQDCPINTQMPQDAYASGEGPGLVTASETCYEVPGIGLVGRAHHTFYAYSSPSYVQYEYDEGGMPRYHPERGISYDVDLDTGVQPAYTFYVTLRPLAGTSPTPDAPLVMPDVKVTARIGASDHLDVSHATMDTAPTIAYGESEAVTLHPFVDHPQVTHYDVDGRHVYAFTFPLAYELGSIDKEASFHIRTDVYVETPVCSDPYGDGYVTPGNVQRHSGNGLWAHLDWNIMNPLRIEYLHPQFIGDDLIVHASVASPWGGYDVDEASLTLAASGPTDAPFQLVNLVQRIHEFDHHRDPVDVTWVWENVDATAAAGTYHVRFDARSDQGAAAHAIASFDVGNKHVTTCTEQEGGAQCTAHSPPPQAATPMPLVATFVGVLVALSRRDNR